MTTMDRNNGYRRRLILWILIILSITSTVHSQELQAVLPPVPAVPPPNDFQVKHEEMPKKEPAVIIVAEKSENQSELNSWTPTAPNVTSWNPTRSFFSRSTYFEDPLPNSPVSRSHYAKEVQGTKKPNGLDKSGIEDFPSRLMNYGKIFFGKFMGPGGSARDDPEVFESEGHASPKAGRGLVNWISRLIGVDGKSLGEFLREYQVHVLYDLVFTFFKWIFFLYVGLLIP